MVQTQTQSRNASNIEQSIEAVQTAIEAIGFVNAQWSLAQQAQGGNGGGRSMTTARIVEERATQALQTLYGVKHILVCAADPGFRSEPQPDSGGLHGGYVPKGFTGRTGSQS